jgi:hypothetical protein
MPTVELAKALWAYVLARLDVDPDSEAGMTTTEIAVVTFLLVGAAIVVMGIIYAAAKNNANSIPEPAAPGTP